LGVHYSTVSKAQKKARGGRSETKDKLTSCNNFFILPRGWGQEGINQRAQEKKYNPPLKMLGRESKKIHPNAIWNR